MCIVTHVQVSNCTRQTLHQVYSIYKSTLTLIPIILFLLICSASPYSKKPYAIFVYVIAFVFFCNLQLVYLVWNIRCAVGTLVVMILESSEIVVEIQRVIVDVSVVMEL